MRQPAPVRPIPFKTRLIVRLLNGLVRLLCVTVRLRVEGEAEAQRSLKEHGGGLMATWHGRTLLPINHFRGRRDYVGLISASHDGDIQAEMFRRVGMGAIRGSTGRRGVHATREVLAALEQGKVVLFTPDGPRGPSGHVQGGVVYFAQRTGKPIIPAGISANPRWLLKTWDSFLVPKPFSRARWFYGDPFFVGPDEDLEQAAQRLAEVINCLERKAEEATGANLLLENRPEPLAARGTTNRG